MARVVGLVGGETHLKCVDLGWSPAVERETKGEAEKKLGSLTFCSRCDNVEREKIVKDNPINNVHKKGNKKLFCLVVDFVSYDS